MDFVEKMYASDALIRKSSKLHGILVDVEEFITGAALLGFAAIACSPNDRGKRLNHGVILAGTALGASLAVLAGDEFLKYRTRKKLDDIMSSEDDDEDDDDDDGLCFPWEEKQPTVTPAGEVDEGADTPEGGCHMPDPEPTEESATGAHAEPTEGTTTDAAASEEA